MSHPLPPHLAANAINWFPGHMRKGLRDMQSRLRLVDVVIECRDARVPLSAVNPHFERLVLRSNKPHLILLNKADLAHPPTTAAFCAHIAARAQVPTKVFPTSLHAPSSLKPIISALTELAVKDPLRQPSITAMVTGTPNVGKSTLLNSLRSMASGRKKAAKTGGQPGVTRSLSNTPITLIDNPRVYIFDSPGIIDPAQRDPESTFRLALTGGIRDHIAGEINLAEYLVFALRVRQQHAGLMSYFGLPQEAVDPRSQGWSLDIILDYVATRIGALDKGGRPNHQRAALFMVTAFRQGKLGSFSLDDVPMSLIKTETHGGHQ